MGVFPLASTHLHGGTTATFFLLGSLYTSIPGFQARRLSANFTRHAHFSSSSSSSSGRPSRLKWMEGWGKGGVPICQRRPISAVDYRAGLSSDDDDLGTSRNSGSSTMDRIVEKLKRFGYIEDQPSSDSLPEKGTVEDIFYSEDGILPDTRGGLSWDLTKEKEVLFPWEKRASSEGDDGELGKRKASRTSLAELTLPETELRRLRHAALRTKAKIKVGGAGVTREIVEKIQEKWRTEEVVRIKCEGPPALNMKRMHEILERKTGGLVVWRSGSSLSLYRGLGYEQAHLERKPTKLANWNRNPSYDESTENSSENVSRSFSKPVSEEQSSSTTSKKGDESAKETNYEHEVDKLLDNLGPRYDDWAGPGPLPIDADLLPGVVPGFTPPFRLLPYGVRPSLGMKEGTALRRLARVLPPHFALGRSRQHQGLASAIVKLWEKSSIVKIALKRGVQLTASERMAVEIQRLTGGILLSRNKDYIVFYRGKDFLSPEVAEALMERERSAKALQEDEERARLQASSSVLPSIQVAEDSGNAGTLGETLEANARWGNKIDEDHKNKIMKASEVARHAQLVRKLERKLSMADRRLMKAERVLGKVEEFLKPSESKQDPESITDEERFMFRKLGLRMKAYLLLGRRGVFGGTVENMHLHWKYRELIKIIVKAKNFSQVRDVALSLEAESGGVLVSVDKISKGFAIIVFRGKDYQRPSSLRPKNLLTKRKALARSIELQRREALLRHISSLQQRVAQLKSELELMEDAKVKGNEGLYDRLDASYSTADDEESEEEGDEAYLEVFDGPEDGDVEDDNDDDDDADDYEDDGNDTYDVDDDEDDDVYVGNADYFVENIGGRDKKT
ncbi:CRM-domain containing factor CFM3, chloroplastic/mitochondrial-like [Wolffia australiana]